jgi:hypothetical protein
VQILHTSFSFVHKWRDKVTKFCKDLSVKCNFKKIKILKGKAIPVQAWIGPEGSRRLRLPGFSESRHVRVAR